jgi:hypothetical protein
VRTDIRHMPCVDAVTEALADGVGARANVLAPS